MPNFTFMWLNFRKTLCKEIIVFFERERKKKRLLEDIVMSKDLGYTFNQDIYSIVTQRVSIKTAIQQMCIIRTTELNKRQAKAIVFIIP